VVTDSSEALAAVAPPKQSSRLPGTSAPVSAFTTSEVEKQPATEEADSELAASLMSVASEAEAERQWYAQAGERTAPELSTVTDEQSEKFAATIQEMASQDEQTAANFQRMTDALEESTRVRDQIGQAVTDKERAALTTFRLNLVKATAAAQTLLASSSSSSASASASGTVDTDA
jgi:hypothetical protein